MRRPVHHSGALPDCRFPFLFGGTFIEAYSSPCLVRGLRKFPFLFGGTFIEAKDHRTSLRLLDTFPFLFGGTFIEAPQNVNEDKRPLNFPSFSEGLSLRLTKGRQAGTTD